MVLFPRVPRSTAREVILVAGPARRKTSATPGLIPLSIKAAATGVESVAQMSEGFPRSTRETWQVALSRGRELSNPLGVDRGIVKITILDRNLSRWIHRISRWYMKTG